MWSVCQHLESGAKIWLCWDCDDRNTVSHYRDWNNEQAELHARLMMGKLVPIIWSCYDSERLSCVMTELQLSVASLLLQTRTSLFLFFREKTPSSPVRPLLDGAWEILFCRLADVATNASSRVCFGLVGWRINKDENAEIPTRSSLLTIINSSLCLLADEGRSTHRRGIFSCLDNALTAAQLITWLNNKCQFLSWSSSSFLK